MKMKGTCRDDDVDREDRRVAIRFGRPFGSLFDRGAFDSLFGGSVFDEIGDLDRSFDIMRREMDEMMGPTADSCGCGCGNEARAVESEGGGVRVSGPRVYGYRMSVGPDGVPRMQEWGNYRPSWAPREDMEKDGGPGLPPSRPMDEKAEQIRMPDKTSEPIRGNGGVVGQDVRRSPSLRICGADSQAKAGRC
jgi:hypothetical protein